jgi:hypothetical protein
VSTFPPYRPKVYADERIPNHIIEDCVAASGVNLAAAATNGRVPQTDAEVLALRAATGDLSGPEGFRDLQAGMTKRYGWGGYLSDQWSAITRMRSEPLWVSVIGQYAVLPDRLRNPGQGNVSHAIALTGDTANYALVIDPLQKPIVTARRISYDELRIYCASGNFASLSIPEYEHATKHWLCTIGGPGRFSVWKQHGGTWVEGHRGTIRTVKRRCSAPRPPRESGGPPMVELLEGVNHGYFVEVAGRISATEVLGA